jgi:hypothetical protein
MNVKVVSYYSPNYWPHAEKLIDSCKRWGLDYEINGVKPFASWHEGVSYKPKYLAQALSFFSHYDAILWIDADAVVVRHLPFDDYRGVDVAASKFQWSLQHKQEILTGTMLLATNVRVQMLLDQWVKDVKNFKHSDTPEQDALVPLINSWSTSINFRALDIEWTWIDDERVKDIYPGKIPAIIHKQASRQIRAEEFRREQSQKK